MNKTSTAFNRRTLHAVSKEFTKDKISEEGTLVEPLISWFSIHDICLLDVHSNQKSTASSLTASQTPEADVIKGKNKGEGQISVPLVQTEELTVVENPLSSNIFADCNGETKRTLELY